MCLTPGPLSYGTLAILTISYCLVIRDFAYKAVKRLQILTWPYGDKKCTPMEESAVVFYSFVLVQAIFQHIFSCV